MSPGLAARAARAEIARSDRLFFDTRSLRFVAGIAKPVEIEPALASDLLANGELKVVAADRNGVVVMELTEEAFKRGAASRQRAKNPHKIDWVYVTQTFTSGVRDDMNVLDASLDSTLVVVPFTGSLLNRLIAVTSDAIDAYGRDSRWVGCSARFPGYLMPRKGNQLRGDTRDLVPLFENTDLNVMVNVESGQYAFGTHVRGVWAGTSSTPIRKLLSEALDGLGKNASRNVTRAASRLLREPIIRDRVIHQDEESHEVMSAIIDAESAYAEPEVV